MKKLMTICLVATIILAIAFVSPAFATLVLDQHWDAMTGTTPTLSIYNFRPIGQEFTPTMDNIAAVSLPFFHGPDAINGVSVTVKIHEGSILGAVIATNNDWVPYSTAITWHQFVFSSPASLTPGSLYVIEASTAAADFFWGWTGYSGAFADGPGHFIRSGNIQSVTNPDSYFMAGIRTYGIPEPATLFLLGLGALSLVRRKK